MASDFKLIFGLSMVLLLPLAYSLCFKVEEQTFSLKTYDQHLEYFRTELKSKDNPDIIFIGTSRTMLGVNPEVLDKKLSQLGGTVQSQNLGVNWFGHGLSLCLIEAWLKKKSPQVIVLEVPMLYHYKLHPNFERVATPGHLMILAKSAFWKGVQPIMKWAPRVFYQKVFLNHLDTNIFFDNFHRSKDKGQVRIHDTKAIRQSQYDQMKALISAGVKHPPKLSDLKKVHKRLFYRHQLAFLEKIKKICLRKKITLVCLPIPKVTLYEADASLAQRYLNIGLYWPIPVGLLNRPELWRDHGHLNLEGSVILANWLAPKFTELLNDTSGNGHSQ